MGFLLLGHLVNLLDCASFAMRDILKLRIIAALASTLAAIYFSFQPVHLWLNIGANVIFTCINLIQIALLLNERKAFVFDNEELHLYQKIFLELTPRQFKKLLKLGTYHTAEKGALLIQEGEVVSKLSIIIRGTAAIIVKGNPVAYCKEDDFIGEISFISESPATAAVEVVEPIKYLQWDQEAITKFINRNLSTKIVFNSIFGKNLINKLKT